MNKNKYRLLIALKILIASVLIGAILSKVNLSDVWLAFSRANIRLVAGAFLLYFLGFCIIALRWKLLLTVQGVQASFYTLVKSMIVAVFFNNFLPSTIGGDAMRAYDTWKMGGGKTQSVSIIFMDRLLGVFTLFMFALLALLLTSIDVTFIPGFRLWVLLAVLAGITTLYILFFRSVEISRYLQGSSKNNSSVIKGSLIKVFNVFAGFNGKPGVLTTALFLSVLLQLNVILHYTLLAMSLDINVPFSAMFIIIPVAIVVMMIPVSINAIGVRELIFVALFGLYGVDSADALAFSWMSFILITILGLIGGIVFMLRKNSAENRQ